MKYILSFSWIRNWNSFEYENQRLIVFFIFAAIVLLILIYVVIPLIELTYKRLFNSEHNKKIKSNWKDSKNQNHKQDERNPKNFSKNIEGRLLKLKDLLSKGIIDNKEYEKQREKILNEL